MSKLYKSFNDLLAAIQSARNIARSEAENDYGKGKGFLKSRGVWMVTRNKKAGLVAPSDENFYSGKAPTARQLDALIADVNANFPSVDCISFEGGFDFAEQMDGFRHGDYDAWVAEWSVEAWRRPGSGDIDELVSRLTGFSTLAEMVDSHPSYRPTIATSRGIDALECAELTDIADAYDAAQIAKGDERRAYRK